MKRLNWLHESRSVTSTHRYRSSKLEIGMTGVPVCHVRTKEVVPTWNWCETTKNKHSRRLWSFTKWKEAVYTIKVLEWYDSRYSYSRFTYSMHVFFRIVNNVFILCFIHRKAIFKNKISNKVAKSPKPSVTRIIVTNLDKKPKQHIRWYVQIFCCQIEKVKPRCKNKHLKICGFNIYYVVIFLFVIYYCHFYYIFVIYLLAI